MITYYSGFSIKINSLFAFYAVMAKRDFENGEVQPVFQDTGTIYYLVSVVGKLKEK